MTPHGFLAKPVAGDFGFRAGILSLLPYWIVFQIRHPNKQQVDSAVRMARGRAEFGPRLLSLRDGPRSEQLPRDGFAHDLLRIRLGHGQATFAAARQAFARYAEFDLGWVRVANPDIPVAAGEIVVVEVHAFGLWSLNLSRIVETIDTADRFGFLYATTSHHAEEGEERFVLELCPEDGAVWYHLEALSRPRHPLARLAYPLTRALQHRFARDSHRRMSRAVLA